MTPVKQRNQHDPENGVYGDCHRAALASLLDLPIDDVPHFMHGLGPKDGEAFNKAQEAWLRKRGLTAIIVPISAGRDVQDILDVCEAWNPGVYYLLGGATARGVGHTVVAGGGKVVHDPHPSNLGVDRPMDDGCFWVTYLGSAAGVMNL